MGRLILTMPIAPYSKFSIGKMSTPILGQALAKKTGGEFCLAVNLLDSYKKRDIADYKSLLEMYKIIPNSYWVDNEHIDELIEKIYLLIEKGYIYSTNKKILYCECKKVEICQDNIKSINMIDSCFEEYDGKYYCKNCKKECLVTTKDVLVFDSRKIEDKKIQFYPEFINKDIKTFNETVGKNEIVISRTRDTGIKITSNNKDYNIDIDFLWEIYLSLFPEKEKIVLCSNHQLFQLYMVLMLQNCFNKDTNTIGIATPYINIAGSDLERSLEERILSLKLFTLFNFKWSKKENLIDEGLITYLNSMNVEKKQQLYNIVMQEYFSDSLENDIKKILLKDFNFQSANKTLKRSRRNV